MNLDRLDALIFGARRGLREAEQLGEPSLIAACRRYLQTLKSIRERLAEPPDVA